MVLSLSTMRNGGRHFFLDQNKSNSEHPDSRKEIDKRALLEYFTFQNLFTDRTLLENVKLFPPATVGCIHPDSENAELKLQQYWDYEFKEPETLQRSAGI